MEKRLNWLKSFLKFTFKQFAGKHATGMAAELTLNTMLALVPLMTVAVSLIALFPAFEDLNNQVQSLIFNNFLPDSGLAVQDQLNQYVAKSKNLSAIGFTFLFITALLLMRSIDKSVNSIWESKHSRHGIYKWLAYWAMLTMSPILIATSLAISSYFAALPFVEQFSGFLTIGIPFVLICLAFTVLFVITPNSSVSFRKAGIAAIFTAVLFEIAKYGFAIFVKKFSTYEVIYGAITAIPLFFIWVYLSWLIVLWGASLCFALHRYEEEHESQESEFIVVLSVMQFFSQAQQGESLVSIEQLKKQFPDIGESALRKYLNELQNLGFVTKTNEEGYCLKVNGAKLTIKDIYRRGSWRLPDTSAMVQSDGIESGSGETLGFDSHLIDANQAIDKILSQTLIK